jgi:pimeloyl-ACP methyl ester carboxylesterase
MLRRTLTLIAILLALLCSYGGMSGARMTSEGSEERALRELEDKWLNAEDDPNSLESILADDFVHVLTVGFVTKREQLTFLRTHPQSSRETKHFEDLKVRTFGSAAVVNGIVVATGTSGKVRRTLFTDVFAYRDGKWLAVNAQELPLTESSPVAGHEDGLTRSDYFVDGESGARLFVRRVTAVSNQHVPILLVHGGSPPSEVIFDLPIPGYSLGEDLARMGLDVFLMDARGWGRSSSPPGGSQPLGESKDVFADIGSVVDDIIRTTGRPRVWLFGHASGGHWAAMYAVQHPDKIAGLVLLNSMYGVDAPWGLRQGFEDPQHPGVFNAQAGPYRLATAEGLLDGWNRSIPVANKSEWRDPRVAETYVTLGLASDPTSESRTPPSLRIPGAFRRDHYFLSKGQKFWDAHDLKIPVLYMRGSRDHWSRPEDLEAMKHDMREVPASRFVTLPDGTHFLFLDRPEHGRTQMLREINEFLLPVGKHSN